MFTPDMLSVIWGESSKEWDATHGHDIQISPRQWNLVAHAMKGTRTLPSSSAQHNFFHFQHVSSFQRL